MDDNELLHTWIERAMALRDAGDALSPEQIQSIALELGITQKDLDRLESALEAQLKRGEGYLEHGLWAQAIEEIAAVAALNPRSAPLHLQLARAHKGRWKAEGDEADRAAAERFARLSLELDPERPEPFALLRALEEKPKRRRDLISPMITHAGVALVAFAAGWGFAEVAAPTPPWEEHSAAQAALVGSAGGDGAGASSATEAPAELEPPVSLAASGEAPGLRLEVRTSLQSNYLDGSSFYRLKALLHNEGALELDELQLELTLLDADGAPVGEPRVVDAIPDFAPLVRPGDAHFFQILERTDPRVRAAALKVQRAVTAPGAEIYGEGQPVELRWLVPQPAHLDLALRARNTHTSASLLKEDQLIFDGVFEVENTGQGSLHSLSLRFVYLDAAGGTLAEGERLVAYQDGDTLFPGERRTFRELKTLSKGYAGYRIEIFEVE